MRRLKKTIRVSFLQHPPTILERRAGLLRRFSSPLWRIIDPLIRKNGGIQTAGEIVLIAFYCHVDVVLVAYEMLVGWVFSVQESP